MKEYGEQIEFPIITLHSRFRARPADIERWRVYSCGAPEYGKMFTYEQVKRAQYETIYSRIPDAALIADFLAKKEAERQAWLRS